MGDDRELLEQERRRHRMGDDAFQRLHDRRDRKRRNRMITSGVLALVIAAAGVTGAALAFRGTGAVQPATSPTNSGPGPSSSPSTAPVPRAPGNPVSGPIQFLDSGHGYWVTPEGAIMAQFGDTPPVVYYQSSKQVLAIDLLDADHWWASTADGLLRSSDAGVKWTFLPGPSLSSFQFVDENDGFGISPSSGTFPLGPGHLVRTRDGGATWTDVATPGPVETMCFVPGTDIGWTAAGASLYRTTDGGGTWQATQVDVGGEAVPGTTVRCDAARDAWALVLQGGAAGHVYHVLFHTSDGTSWQPVVENGGLNPGSPVPGVYASDDPHPGPMAVTGPNGVAFVPWCPACGHGSVDLLRTTDSGTTWTKLAVAGPDNGGEPVGTSFIDPDHGWVLLTVSTDKGPTWAVAAVTGSTVTLASQQTVP